MIGAFLMLKVVEIGFVLAVFAGIGCVVGIILGVGFCVKSIVEKICGCSIDWDTVVGWIGASFLCILLLAGLTTWMVVNGSASKAVVEKWENNPNVNKWGVVYRHAILEKDEKETNKEEK